MKKIVLFGVVLLLIGIVRAVPETISLQGQIASLTGTAQESTFGANFSIYDNITSGVKLYNSSSNITTDSNGIFNIILYNVTLNGTQQYYLGVQIDGGTETSPRYNLTTSIYSIRSESLDCMDDNCNFTNVTTSGKISTRSFDIEPSGNDIYFDYNKVDGDVYFRVNDGGTMRTVYYVDASNLGVFRFTSQIDTSDGNEVIINSGVANNRELLLFTTGGIPTGGIYARQDDGLHLVVDETDNVGNRNLIITEYDHRVKDHDHDTLSPNPTLFIHSDTDPDTNNTQWMSFTHNQSDGVIETGAGNLYLNPIEGSVIANKYEGDGSLLTGISTNLSGTEISPTRIHGDSDNVKIGTGDDSQGLTSTNDLFITGNLEVDGVSYFDNNVRAIDYEVNRGGVGSGSIKFQDGTTLASMFVTSSALNEFYLSITSTAGRNLIIGDTASTVENFDHATSDNPTIFLHSSTDPDTNNTQWGSQTHNKTDYLFTTGAGDFHFHPEGNDTVVHGKLVADDVTDLTPAYDKSSSEALKDIKKIKSKTIGNKKEIDHSTLPSMAQSKISYKIRENCETLCMNCSDVNCSDISNYKLPYINKYENASDVVCNEFCDEKMLYKEGRSLSAMVTILTEAVKALSDENDLLKEEICKLNPLSKVCK